MEKNGGKGEEERIRERKGNEGEDREKMRNEVNSKGKTRREDKDIQMGKVKIGFININVVKLSTWADIEDEFEEGGLAVVGVVATHLRNRSKWEGNYYRMEAKGRDR